MSAPVVTGQTSYNTGASNLTTPWAPFSAETVAAGELLVLVVIGRNATDITTATAGWTLAASTAFATVCTAIFTKVATGTSEGISLDFTGSGMAAAAFLVRVTGADTCAGSFAGQAFNSATIDPPSYTADRVRDILWIAVAAVQKASPVPTVNSAPSGYSGLVADSAPDANNAVAGAVAYKIVTSSQTEDPGTFGLTASSNNSSSGTLAIYKYRRGVRFAWAS